MIPSTVPVTQPRTLTHGDIEHALRTLRGAARALTHSQDEADDLVQETVAHVLRRPRRITGDDATGYLLRALRNTWVNEYRTQARRPSCEPIAEHHEPHASDADVDRGLMDDHVWWLVGTLPSIYSAVVATVVMSDLSYREAAAVLGVPIGTVMSRLHRARHLLATRLEH